ncbi:MAG: protease inhibitor I42 family protein [Chloroflexi bacterium]|nr:protease inhibitor I42 family protein [Chloroflexota bacterium]
MWTFKAVGKGNTTIVMKYVRPWEKGGSPAQTRTFDITVSTT